MLQFCYISDTKIVSKLAVSISASEMTYIVSGGALNSTHSAASIELQ